MDTLIVATRNAHKVGEIAAILGGGIRLLSLKDLPGAPAVVEDASTFAGNATKKAAALARWLAGAKHPALKGRCWVLADDSGLEVDALAGAPGVQSARFAALETGASGNSTDADNNAKLLRLLCEVPTAKRTARFRCVLALVEASASGTNFEPHLFEGACEGRIGFAAHGSAGFGYDPLFTPSGRDQTFAELGEDIKNRLSHRARALGQLRTWLDGQSGG